MAIFNTVPPLKAGAGIKFDGETISTGAAPRNLLDNSDFRNPVNQRGQTSYTLGTWGGYCLDRWAAASNGATITIGSGGLTLSGNIYQPISSDVIARYNGKVLTLAVKMAGTVYCCSGEVKQIGTWNRSALLDTPYGTISFETEDDNAMFVIIDSSTTPSVVEWAALYEGAYTAETLPEYQPKGYAAELAECKRYFVKYQDVRLVPFVFDGTTLRHYRLIHDIPMHFEHPTVDASGLVERKVWGDIASQFNFYGSDKNGVTFSATCEVSDNSSIYVAGTIAFDADL